jgi:predicted Rdx family selenoprotein
MSDPRRDDEDSDDAKPSKAGEPDETPGQFGFDDRGNITWEWKQDEALLAEDTLGAAARVRALLDPNLDLADVEPAPHDPRNPKGLAQGYDPYQSGLLVNKERKKRRDLRALSEWVELKKKHGGKPPV